MDNAYRLNWAAQRKELPGQQERNRERIIETARYQFTMQTHEGALMTTHENTEMTAFILVRRRLE